jgi:hypothetical protein
MSTAAATAGAMLKVVTITMEGGKLGVEPDPLHVDKNYTGEVVWEMKGNKPFTVMFLNYAFSPRHKMGTPFSGERRLAMRGTQTAPMRLQGNVAPGAYKYEVSCEGITLDPEVIVDNS